MNHKKIIIIFVLALMIGTNLSIAKTVSNNQNNFVVRISNKETNVGFTDWWTCFHHDEQNTGKSTSNAPESNDLLWSFSTGNKVYSSPAIYDNKVYFGSTDYKIYCLDADTGSEIWNYPTLFEITSSPAIGDIDSDGTMEVVIGSELHDVLVINEEDGTLQWSYNTGGSVWSSPVLNDVDGDGALEIIIGSASSKVYVFNHDGTVRSVTSVGDWIAHSSPAIYEGKIYVGCFDDKLYCLDANSGIELWSFNTDDNIDSSPVVSNNKVFIGSYDGKMYCLDADDGSEIWNFNAGHNIYSTPAIYNDKLYFGDSYYGKVYCLNVDDGSKIWEYNTGYSITSSPAIADGKIYIGCGDKKVYCLDADDGSKLWSYYTGGAVKSSPGIANGRVYIGSDNGNLYCFGPDDQSFTVEITNPDDGDTVSGTVQITVDITGGVPPILMVGFNIQGPGYSDSYIDNNGEPWEYSWATPQGNNGEFTIEAFTMDGDSTFANDIITVFVDNDQLDQQMNEQHFSLLVEDPVLAAAQSFKPTLPTLTRVEIFGSGHYKCSIRDDLDGPDLRAVTEYYPDDEQGWLLFDFQDLTVTPESAYYIVLEPLDDVTHSWGGYYLEDNYKRGQGYYNIDGQGWSIPDESDSDYMFRTYGRSITDTADLDCTGTLNWANVGPAESVVGYLEVSNIGQAQSKLDWEIDEYPNWGTWTFSPNSGTDLTPDYGPYQIEVEVVAPYEANEDFSGEVKIINSNNPSDSETIQVELSTPRSKEKTMYFLISSLLENYPIICKLVNFIIKF